MSQPQSQDDCERDDEATVPVGVLEGIEDLEDGRTLSDEELDDVLKF